MSKMNDQIDIRLINLENKLFNEIKLLQIKDGERNVEIQTLQKQVSILKNLLDQYFTLEIDQIKDNHAKRKVLMVRSRFNPATRATS